MGATTSSFALYSTDEKEVDSSLGNPPSPPDVPEAVSIDSRRCTSASTSDSSSSSSGSGGGGGGGGGGGSGDRFNSRTDCSSSSSGGSRCSTASSYCKERPEAHDSEGPSRKRTTIESLPDEVLIKVLAAVNSTASSPLDVVLPSMINRRWRRASRDREALRRACRGGVAVRARQWCEGAYMFLRRLCENGCLEAAFMLAMILFYCIPGAQFEGGRLLMYSAREGHAASLYTAGILSFNGSGLGAQHKDARMGVALCARAAALGHTEAMRELGHCLIDGYGVQRDAQEGWRMLLEAQAAELAPQAYLLSLLSAMPAASPASDFGSTSASDSSFASAAAYRACNSSPYGNTMPLTPAEQETAVHLLLARDWRAAPTSPIRGDSSACSSSSCSASGAVACGDDDMAGDEAAESSDGAFLSAAGLSPRSPSSVLVAMHSPRSPMAKPHWPTHQQHPLAADSAAAATTTTTTTITSATTATTATTSINTSSKQAVVQKLLAGLASGSFRLTAAHVAALEPALAALQTSLRPAPIHPAHAFVREWRALKGAAPHTAEEKPHAVAPATGATAAATAAEEEPESAEGGDASAGVCSRASCGRPETRPFEFWRCSTCWRVRYCSRSCQVHHWRETHARTCTASAAHGDDAAHAAHAPGQAHGPARGGDTSARAAVASAHRSLHGMGVL
ncbi:hypothetical protein CLOM_g2022 [Closterium sp. NIES-68]|nr:hypothetical protein CLOM_g2022 [Closterium sp. NIES-68]GJP67477.1 hypothetical protein CLOP_g24296 [Closterium sp. NIES-67]